MIIQVVLEFYVEIYNKLFKKQNGFTLLLFLLFINKPGQLEYQAVQLIF